jgi:spermidine synthase
LSREPERARRRLLLALMLASGFAGLGYQIVWTQQCALWLGHEAPAVLAVIAAFFGGLAFGALLFGERIRLSRRPLLWYAGCELLIALWGLLLSATMPAASAWLLRLTSVDPGPLRQWGLAFGGTLLLLLPATAAMGATLPAMQRLAAQETERLIAPLYAANTLGAALGVLATAFWLVPGLGLRTTAGLCVVLNLLCAAGSWLAARAECRSLQPRPPTPIPPTRSKSLTGSGTLLRLLLTGLLGVGYEVLVVRVLSQVAEDTVYTFAMLLAVYLVGAALGAAAYQRWLARCAQWLESSDALLCALALACLSGGASLWAAERVKALSLALFGAGMGAALAAETVLALAAFALPTLVMGALFSQLSARAVAAGHSLGRALGVNTLGAAAAPLVVGVLAFPGFGAKRALLLIVLAYLLMVSPRRWRSPVVLLPFAALAALAVWAPPLAFIDLPEGGRVVSYREGVMAAVSVVEDAGGVLRLRIDNRQQEGSSATRHVDARQAWLPLLLHPAPQRALFLGLGTGVTASSAAQAPQLQVDAVELLPEVIEASAYFGPAAGAGDARARLHLIQADARRYVRASAQRYDLIVADNFHPARSGSGALYTVEHFRAVRERLGEGAVFCQWLPLHQLDLDTLRSIVQSFLAVYPNGWAMLANNSLDTPVFGLIARREPGRFDFAALRGRLAQVLPEQMPAQLGIEDEFALLGSFVAGPQALRHFAGTALANTDDRPVVAYRAPRITYAPDSSPRERLVALLRELSIRPEELLDDEPGSEDARRLAAYWMARDRFIEAGREVVPSSDVREMLAQVREPLLSVLRISPDFRPAYDPLLLMARALAQTEPVAARALLGELAQAQPARPEAALILGRLGGTP